ncbi:MAG TPA: transporter [Stellaceae bacterium]|nr:transporter [Stellaceae bacterium]
MSSSSGERGGKNLRRLASVSLGIAPCVLSAAAFLFGMAPAQSLACACGCGVFAVGTSSMFPSGSGGTVYLDYDYQDQTINWSGNSRAPAADNGDKDIRTNFFTAGLQYMFNRSWGVQVEVPYWDRKFTTDQNFPTPPPDLLTAHWSVLGDIRIEGLYTGFSEDLSSGLTFGVKVPTGNYQYDSAVVDRDSQIGSGSTDLLLGGYHRDGLGTDTHWSWFVQALLDQPVLTSEGYRPGTELDTAGGVIYSSFDLGAVQISPLVQVIFSERTRDSGPQSASPLASGYQRVLFSPGVEFDMGSFSTYVDIELPVYQNFNGDQLTAPWLLKFIAAYRF